MKQLILLFVLLLGVMGMVAWLNNKSDEGGLTELRQALETKKQPTVVVGEVRVPVEVADTKEEREKGLSGRESLEKGKGVLFEFAAGSRPQFWMKEMKFAIDIIWINDDVVRKIDENVPPPAPGTKDEELVLYASPGEIDYVLEVAGGWAKEVGIKVGDRVALENI